MSRRDALRLAGQATAAAGLASVALPGLAGAAPATPDGGRGSGGALDHSPWGPYDDEMFDVQAVLAGAWAPGPYGPDDQRGSFNEVTPRKTARALSLLNPKKPVKTYNLGELMFNGFPAYITVPARTYEQRLVLLGYEPPADFDGFVQGTEPAGPNKISAHEERFVEAATYQIGTQLDNLNHVGVGTFFYNGFRGPEIAADYGTTKLGNEHMGPIVTRGVLLDILGLKLAQGASGDVFTAPNGEPVLRDNYRITLEDILAALQLAHVNDIRPGDAVIFRTGWTHLVRTDPDRYLAQEPGIYLREARYLADRRPALIGSDTWALEVLDPAVTEGNAFPVHQLLLAKHGIRINEAVVTEGLAADKVYEFVYSINPQNALGATAGNSPPLALANL